METIYIKKVANGYTVEISGNWDVGSEDELFLYKTRAEMTADLGNVIERAHQLGEEAKAKRAAKENKK